MSDSVEAQRVLRFFNRHKEFEVPNTLTEQLQIYVNDNLFRNVQYGDKFKEIYNKYPYFDMKYLINNFCYYGTERRAEYWHYDVINEERPILYWFENIITKFDGDCNVYIGIPINFYLDDVDGEICVFNKCNPDTSRCEEWKEYFTDKDMVLKINDSFKHIVDIMNVTHI